MARWRQLTKAGGLAVGALAAGAGVVIAAEKIAVGRLRLRPDPAAGELLGQLRDQSLTVLADDGVPLHVEISGPDEAPVTIVFSHGYTLSQDVWHFQRKALSGARLVFWDQRGHGRSGRGDPERSTIGQLGADLGAVLGATMPAGGRVVLVGHSMGGMTIMALAAQRPELFAPAPDEPGPDEPGLKVAGTVLIATAASGIDPGRWLPAPLRLVARQTAPMVLRSVSRGWPAAVIERSRQAAGDVAFLSTRYMAFGDPGVSPAMVDFLERIIRATPVEVVAEFYLALVDHDQEAALGTLGAVPCTVVAGDRDRLISARRSGELAAQIPGAELVLVPGAGHLVILERPEAVNEAITALVARI
ncbi:MAG TPA: alpha/beta hydrolase [Streptosporangiaceae bacterium]|nr:alpha/beta hydrolase [Streptosporangiaceae bacterium]